MATSAWANMGGKNSDFGENQGYSQYRPGDAYIPASADYNADQRLYQEGNVANPLNVPKNKRLNFEGHMSSPWEYMTVSDKNTGNQAAYGIENATGINSGGVLQHLLSPTSSLIGDIRGKERRDPILTGRKAGVNLNEIYKGNPDAENMDTF